MILRAPRLRLVVLAGAVASTSWTPSTSPAAEVVLRRAVSLEEIAGRARVRTVYGSRVDVFVACQDGGLECSETVRFEQVVAIELALETRADRGGEVVASEESAGRVLLGASLDEDGYDRFRSALDRRLAALSAEAYRRPLAGFDTEGPPFDARTLARTEGAAWVCLDRPEGRTVWRHERNETPGEDGGPPSEISLGSSGYGDPNLADPICDQLAAAAASAWPDEVRTLTVPTLLEITEVAVEDAIDLRDEAWRDELAELPEGTVLVRRERPGTVAGRSIGSDERSATVRATWTRDGIEHEALVAPARLPARLIDGLSVAQRWTVERSAGRLGPRPSDAVLDRVEVVVAWFPVLPPGEETPDGTLSEPGDGPFDVRYDRDAMLDEVAARLRDVGSLTAEAIGDAVTMQPVGLDSDGWMFVVCLPNGRGHWGLPPTEARAEAIDPLPLCGAIDAILP